MPCAVYALLGAPIAALLFSFFFFYRVWPSRTHWPILASCATVTAASWWLAWRVLAGDSWDATLFHWMFVGGFGVDFGVRIDGLSASVLAMVTVVGTLIHAYAVGYMEDDPGFSRFFMYFHFFFLSMIGLLISNNYLEMYMFWEGVGLSSFLLIGFWYDRPMPRAAAWKAFLTNRVGDIGFLLAVFLMLAWAGTARFTDLFQRLDTLPHGLIPFIALLLFWGASAKSAQFPLHVWLPDAMEGPTPVSALMHAATMVTAGVFLMARSWPLLERAPEVRLWIACVGALTSLGAALIASMKKDLKRILAYSTLSHLGLMMLAIGCGNVYAAVLHLIMHGFFKALLFLCAGSVIHGLGAHGSATVDDAGGLSRQMRVTSWCFWIGALALAGIPPLSGYFSKERIVDAVFAGGPMALKSAALLIAVFSGFYIFRMDFLTFYGDRSRQAGLRAHAHEPGAWMQFGVIGLAILCAVGGAASGLIGRMLGAEVEALSLAQAWPGLLMAVLGIAGAAWLTLRVVDWDWEWRIRHPRVESMMDGEWGWQAACAAVAGFVGGGARWLAYDWDLRRWDRWTEALADSFVGLGEGLSGLSRGILNEYLWWMLAGSVAVTVMAALWF